MNSKSSKILYVGFIPPSMYEESIRQKGTYTPAQQYNHLLASGLALNGCDVHVLALQEKDADHKRKHVEDGIHYHFIPTLYLPKMIGVSRVAYVWLFTALFFLRYPNTVVVGDYLTNIFFYITSVGRLFRKKVFSVVTDFAKYLSNEQTSVKWLKHCDKSIHRSCGYIVISKQMMDKLPNKPSIVIEGIVPVSSSDSKKGTVNNLSKQKICIYAGSIHKKYGMEMLIDGFLSAKLDNWELHFYGLGDYVDSLKKIENECPQIRYRGVVTLEELREIEENASLLMNPRPSTDEYTKYSFPSKLMEYMTTGTYVATTKLPAIPDEYEDYMYFIVPENASGIKDMFRKIEKMGTKALREKGKNAKTYVEANKNAKIQGEKVLELLNG
ncbi:glycosyltransferase [Eubacteriales bacterium OttesenSCG-928-M02]|nr:glycosyltransferase [Eubacteriales bacterium OttesenSCG-928-M02]